MPPNKTPCLCNTKKTSGIIQNTQSKSMLLISGKNKTSIIRLHWFLITQQQTNIVVIEYMCYRGHVTFLLTLARSHVLSPTRSGLHLAQNLGGKHNISNHIKMNLLKYIYSISVILGIANALGSHKIMANQHEIPLLLPDG